MCHAPCYNTEPVIAGIKIYICVTIKNCICCPSCLTTGIKNYKYLNPCPHPNMNTWGPGPGKRGRPAQGLCTGKPLGPVSVGLHKVKETVKT